MIGRGFGLFFFGFVYCFGDMMEVDLKIKMVIFIFVKLGLNIEEILGFLLYFYV